MKFSNPADALLNVSIQITIKMSPDSLIAEFRNEVCRLLGITETDIIWFMFSGRQLQDHQTLLECKVFDCATIHLLGRLRGGGPLNFSGVDADPITTAYAARVRWFDLSCHSSTEDLVT